MNENHHSSDPRISSGLDTGVTAPPSTTPPSSAPIPSTPMPSSTIPSTPVLSTTTAASTAMDSIQKVSHKSYQLRALVLDPSSLLYFIFFNWLNFRMSF